ncbi:MAG: hypothetical protein CSA70_02015 [Rhodobacterales bacterium]|nr:MAG: hypothetical protein CSA70_02015 [Rhodobacterales bacterium]
MSELTMTPPVATVIFVAACLAGYQFRRVWKEEGPNWQLWLFGGAAGAGLLILGFLPLQVG